MNIPSNEKYIIFLKKSYFKSTYKKLINNLESYGITIFNIDKSLVELKRINKYKNNKIFFDDMTCPNINTLYINLFDGLYYNDNIYNKKKIEIEQNMLLILSGKLGVKHISHYSDITETIISKSIFGNNKKTIYVKEEKVAKGDIEYLNNGAPIYYNLINIEMLKSNIFDYNLYKNNLKLQSFVYKRCEFKMLKLEYIIETDDIAEISFATKLSFAESGLNKNLLFDKYFTNNEKITFSLEFFNDSELKNNSVDISIDSVKISNNINTTLHNRNNSFHPINEYLYTIPNKSFIQLKENIQDKNIQDKNMQDKNMQDKNMQDKNIQDKNIQDKNMQDKHTQVEISIESDFIEQPISTEEDNSIEQRSSTEEENSIEQRSSTEEENSIEQRSSTEEENYPCEIKEIIID